MLAYDELMEIGKRNRFIWQEYETASCRECHGAGYVPFFRRARGGHVRQSNSMCSDCRLLEADLFEYAGVLNPKLKDQYGDELRRWGDLAARVIEDARAILEAA